MRFCHMDGPLTLVALPARRSRRHFKVFRQPPMTVADQA
jgi:hypothetical protein